MSKQGKSRTEDGLTESQKKSDQALKRKQKAWRETTEKSARLRALRLAKEAAEKDTAAAPGEPEEPTAGA